MRSRSGETPASSLPQKLLATVVCQRRTVAPSLEERRDDEDVQERVTAGASVTVAGMAPYGTRAEPGRARFVSDGTEEIQEMMEDEIGK